MEFRTQGLKNFIYILIILIICLKMGYKNARYTSIPIIPVKECTKNTSLRKDFGINNLKHTIKAGHLQCAPFLHKDQFS